jgi:hypothetical protein
MINGVFTIRFGDQMATLSYQTRALTVDGNYHSARRLPELTSRAVERLKIQNLEDLKELVPHSSFNR